MIPTLKRPHALSLAIAGHRRLHPSQSTVSNSIRSTLEIFATIQLTLLSPLAEGADRLAAHEILRLPNGILRAVLPLPADDYESDFPTPESRAEFRQLLAAAEDIQVLPPQPSRTEAYLAVGCHLVDSCDILLAIWDGEPARGMGGTAEVVAYARKCRKPMVLIDSIDPSRITRENLPE